MRYPGGKGAAGACQKIIGLMPPHELYVEPYLGGGAVLIAKRPAARSIASDLSLYRYEVDAEHHRALLALLALLVALPCMVVLSGYRSALYDEALQGWNRLDYRTMTRRGAVIESAWFNFPDGGPLHDPRFAGADYRERERIKKKKARWVRMLSAMPPAERQAVAEALSTVAAGGGAAG